MLILYKTLFALFHQIGSGQWPPEFDADVHKGVVGVTLLQAIFAISLDSIIEVKSGHNVALSDWWIWGLFLCLTGINYYFLVTLRVGTGFLTELGHYPRRKRALLYGLASGLVILVGIFCVYSVNLHRRTFVP